MTAPTLGLVDLPIQETTHRIDQLAAALQSRVARIAAQPALRPVVKALSGESWLGHPAHPAIVTVPAGAWAVTAWFDAQSVLRPDSRAETVADAALKFGIVTAVPAALTGITQFLRTDGPARRVAAVHWTLNASSVVLYTVSSVLRGRGSRRAARRVALIALALVGPGAYLGGQLVYKYGVGRMDSRP